MSVTCSVSPLPSVLDQSSVISRNCEPLPSERSLCSPGAGHITSWSSDGRRTSAGRATQLPPCCSTRPARKSGGFAVYDVRVRPRLPGPLAAMISARPPGGSFLRSVRTRPTRRFIARLPAVPCRSAASPIRAPRSSDDAAPARAARLQSVGRAPGLRPASSASDGSRRRVRSLLIAVRVRFARGSPRRSLRAEPQ